MSDMIFGFFTATRVQWEGEDPEPIEEHGWVDMNWNRRILFDSRNDVGPCVKLLSDDPYLAEEVSDALSELPGGWEDNGDGTFYAADLESPYDEEWSYSYALHFTRKFQDANGVWREESWHPWHDGKIVLK